MKKFQGFGAVAVASLAFAGTAAHADTLWEFSYSGSGVSASGSFETVGNGSTPTEVTSMTGTYSDGISSGAISLVADPTPGAVATSADGLYYYDNMFGGTPSLDIDGLLFDAGAQEINLYTDPGLGLTSLTDRNGGYVYSPVSSFSVTAVPEPGSMALLLAGLGALGIASRRRAR